MSPRFWLRKGTNKKAVYQLPRNSLGFICRAYRGAADNR